MDVLASAENSTRTSVESWFIPLDILMITCNALSIILATLFISLIILDRTCHTVSMMLVASSCLATFTSASAMLIPTSFTLQNDLRQIQYQFPLCVFLGYLIYVTCTIQNYSLLLQAIYRYLLIAYPTHLFWHSARTQLTFICVSWIIAIILPMEYLFTGQIIYNVDNQICQMTFKLSFSVIYMAFCLFAIPVSMIMLIYFILVRYVNQMRTHLVQTNTLPRAQRNLQMVRRIVILVSILVTICFPYQLFLLMSFFNRTPKYNFRIAFIFGDAAMLCVIITLFQFTDPLKASLMKRIKRRPNRIVPAVP